MAAQGRPNDTPFKLTVATSKRWNGDRGDTPLLIVLFKVIQASDDVVEAAYSAPVLLGGEVDPVWQSYWNGGAPREGPVVRAVQECRQAVLWNGTVGITLLNHQQANGLAVVPLIDMPPSRVVVAWHEGDTNPLVRSFVRIAIAAYRDGAPTDPS